MIRMLGKILEPNGIALHELEYVKVPHDILHICGDLPIQMVAA